MKILVTGANGFVGGWLTKELSALGHEVIAVVKDEKEDLRCFDGLANIHIVYCDLSALSQLPNLVNDNVDVIYHLAWVSAGGAGRADYLIQLKNAIYASDMIKVAMELHAKKILYAGTVSERLVDNFLESEIVGVNNIYAVSKKTTHSIVDILCKKNHLDYIWMQFANLFGPYSINGNIVGYTISELLSNKEAFFGPANQPYDFIYIEDLVSAMVLLGTQSTKQRFYYIGSGQPHKLSDYLLEIGEILHCLEKIKIGARADDGTRYNRDWFNINPLEEEFNFRPSITFQEGVKRTVEWMKSTSTRCQ